MADVFSVDNMFTLLMLIFLQAVLGFDNLLYISLESKRVQEDKQKFVRQMGIGLAILLRIVLLYVVVEAISAFQDPWFGLYLGDLVHGTFNIHSLIVLAGGVFIIYTAFKEIMHMLSMEDLHDAAGAKGKRSVGVTIGWIGQYQFLVAGCYLRRT